MDKKPLPTDGNYLFNVDILINARTNPLALQLLLEMLNGSEAVEDFNIKSGIKLGNKIDLLLQSAKAAVMQQASAPAEVKKTDAAVSRKQQAQPEAAHSPAAPANAYEKIRSYIQTNQLVRLRANRLGKQITLPCRILNFDENSNNINVYHVDEKQVYTFNLNEIDEFM